MCNINDNDDVSATEVIHYENFSTETYASTYMVKCGMKCHSWIEFFLFFIFFSTCKVADYTKRKTNHKAFDSFKALCNEKKPQCEFHNMLF